MHENDRIILLKWGSKKIGLIADKIIGLVWINDVGEEQKDYDMGEYSLSFIEPDDIWDLVGGFSDGSDKI